MAAIQHADIIKQADIAAFGTGRAEHANALVGEAGMRIDHSRRRGRGAGINPTGRFEPTTRQDFDDGWTTLEELPAFNTDVQVEKPRTIITRNDSPDISFDRSINPYRACLPVSILNLACSPSQMPRAFLSANWPRQAISQKPSPLARTPIPTSRSRRNGASCAKFSKCWKRPTTRSAS